MAYLYDNTFSVIKRNNGLIHVTTWMNLENMLSERSQSLRTMYVIDYVIPFI